MGDVALSEIQSSTKQILASLKVCREWRCQDRSDLCSWGKISGTTCVSYSTNGKQNCLINREILSSINHNVFIICCEQADGALLWSDRWRLLFLFQLFIEQTIKFPCLCSIGCERIRFCRTPGQRHLFCTPFCNFSAIFDTFSHPSGDFKKQKGDKSRLIFLSLEPLVWK